MLLSVRRKGCVVTLKGYSAPGRLQPLANLFRNTNNCVLKIGFEYFLISKATGFVHFPFTVIVAG